MYESANESRDHLEHLPGQSYLLVVAAPAVVVLIVAFSQMMSSTRDSDALLWGIVVIVATLSIVALAVAWEERRAHIHAVVRQALEAGDAHARQAATAELLRLGAHREVKFLHAGVGGLD